jgi:hypothetical protein
MTQLIQLINCIKNELYHDTVDTVNVIQLTFCFKINELRDYCINHIKTT